MNYDPALTPAHIEAFNSVNLHLVGVTHGITRRKDGVPHVESGNAEDFDRLMDAVNGLDIARGDRYATEPTGFRFEWEDDLSLANILPFRVPDTAVSEMSSELRQEIAGALEMGRQDLFLNNLAYAAAHAVLRGIPIERADVPFKEWEALNRLLPEIAPHSMHEEIQLFARNTKMMQCLGDIAVGMRASLQKRNNDAVEAEKPTLLFASGRTHTPRLAARLQGVASVIVDL